MGMMSAREEHVRQSVRRVACPKKWVTTADMEPMEAKSRLSPVSREKYAFGSPSIGDEMRTSAAMWSLTQFLWTRWVTHCMK